MAKKSRYRRQKKKGQKPHKQVLSLEQAVSLFSEMADMSDIAFGHVQNGCGARTHIMCKRLQARGYEPRKAWAFRKGFPFFYVQLPNGETVRWCYHVAPVLKVVAEQGLYVRELVFDPALFDGPVTIGTWRRAMQLGREAVQVCDFNCAPYGSKGAYVPEPISDIDGHALKDMADYLPKQVLPRMVFKTMATELVAPNTIRGRTWVSTAHPAFSAGVRADVSLKAVKQNELNPE